MPAVVMLRSTINWVEERGKMTCLAGAGTLKLIPERILCESTWTLRILLRKKWARDSLTGWQEVEAATGLELLCERDVLNQV